MNPSRTPAASPLDLSRWRGKLTGMRSLLALCALLSFFLPAHADSIIRIVGTPSWQITGPVCRFKVDGPIQNLSPIGTGSGTLKLVLFMSKTLYPATGSQVSELELGQLAGQTQFDKAAGKSLAIVPKVTGEYFFTMMVAEYTISGWRVRAYLDAGKRKLKDGVFVTGTKWVLPKGPVLPPPGKLVKGDFIRFRQKAMENMDMISPSSQLKTMVQFQKNHNCLVTEVGEQVKVGYSYKTSIVTSKGKISNVGNLTVDFGNLTDSIYQTQSLYVLYFTTGLSGYFKRTDLVGIGRKVTWGLFSLNGGAFPESAAATAKTAGVEASIVSSDPLAASAWLASQNASVEGGLIGPGTSPAYPLDVVGGLPFSTDCFIGSMVPLDPFLFADWFALFGGNEPFGGDAGVDEETSSDPE